MRAFTTKPTAPAEGAETMTAASPLDRQRVRGRRVAVAVALSVLVHGLIFLIPPREPRHAPRHAVLTVVEMADLEDMAPEEEYPEERLAEAVLEPEASTVPSPVRGRPTAAPPRASSPAADPETEVAATESAGALAAAAGPASEPPALDAKETEPVEEPAESAAQTIDLFPPDVLAGLGAGQESPLDDPGETLLAPPGRSPADRAAMAERRLAMYVRDQKARHRVGTGLIDPYFVRLREAFDDEFEPEWDHFDSSAGEGLIADLAAWLRDHREVMERYGATGSPYRPGEQSSVGPHHPLAHPIAPAGNLAPEDSRLAMAERQMMATLFLDIANGKAGGIEIVAVVRVTQSPAGDLLRVEIERSSGRAVYDDLARESIRKALAVPRLPERAGEGLGLTGDRIETLWAFRTRFVVAPPMPMGACSFDIGEKPDCVRPLQRRALPKIELEAVY